ncbi:MAG: thioredoxin-disulfide reductase [Desulfatibacillaceae bacterium]
MSDAQYDCIIIGGGPAGLTAGLYLSRARVNVLLLERAVCGGQILVSDWVENYPGFPEGISGADLVFKMSKQAERFGLEVQTAEVTSVDFAGDVKQIHCGDKTYTTKSVILATGATPRRLGVPGENEFYGRGVSFCATCDAPFYKDRTVVAVGGGDTAVQESLFLTKFAKKVYLVHRRDALRAAKVLQERAFANERLEIVWDSVVTGVKGMFNLEGVAVRNVKTGEESLLAAEGCFIWVGIVPLTGYLRDAVEKDEVGFVVANGRMETSAPGVFAAGDIRTTPLRQVVTAVGDAAIAAVSVEHYLDNVEAEQTW